VTAPNERRQRPLTLADFDYDLPTELIAQTPLEPRDAARLLVVDRSTATLHHAMVRDLADWLGSGDLLVANNSRVLPARLHGVKRDTGAKIELLLLRKEADGAWAALARPAKKLKPGVEIVVPPHPQASGTRRDLVATVEAVGDEGEVRVRLADENSIALADFGETPLPPYIRTPLADAERYQTVYASAPGSAAAPTAGLHFTPALLARLRDAGLGWAEVTLHVGLDTFRPVTEERIAAHRIHREWCEVSDATARAVAATKARGGRAVAIGTTAARTLETLGRDWNPERPAGMTTMSDVFITPGFEWTIVDAMLTNFHLPRSTLLMMISSFAGRDLTRRAYDAAIAAAYRFYSFGDAMLIR
jgi:S-adenosylmethionine:tRNA ribosyltransferase-isomerase